MSTETLSDGADPWCTWCDVDITPGPIYLIKGRDEGRWPPAFCSRNCASKWGCAAHQEKIYKADDEHAAELLAWVDENTDVPTILSEGEDG